MSQPRPSSTLPSFARRFRTTGVVTLWAVYLLILVGGIVRGTGAGMGCPDWPKCFGRWVPPTSVTELPADYKEVYRAGRIAKNQQVAARLEKMGFHEVALNIFRNPASYIETDFNATKTWIEYVNRLLGAVIGLLITLTFVRSWAYWAHDKVVTVVAGLALVTVGIQGWLGSLVVSTNLIPEMVTWHMAFALLLLALLHYAQLRTGILEASSTSGSAPDRLLPVLAWGFVVAVFAQILLGTQVREGIDIVASKLNYLNRDLWIERLGPEFSYHRAFSILLLLVGVWIGFRAWATERARLQRQALWLAVLLVLNPLIGWGLAQWAVPAWLQPLHLTIGTGLFGAAVVLALLAGQAANEKMPRSATSREEKDGNPAGLSGAALPVPTRV